MNLNSDPSHELLEFYFILGGAFLITVISFVAVSYVSIKTIILWNYLSESFSKLL